MADRMFHVLVLGGFALAGCGGSVGTGAKAPAEDAAGGSNNGGSEGSLEGASPGADAASAEAAGDGWIPIEGPQLLLEAGAPDSFIDAFADAAPDANADGTCFCCTGFCEAPQ
jgi:hypothetical protein